MAEEPGVWRVTILVSASKDDIQFAASTARRFGAWLTISSGEGIRIVEKVQPAEVPAGGPAS